MWSESYNNNSLTLLESVTALITFSYEFHSTCIKTEWKHYPLTLPYIDCVVDEEAAKTIS